MTVEYLRATATNRRAPAPTRPDESVLRDAFRLAVRRRFRAETPVADITRVVRNAASRHAPMALPVLETEMLIRDALGEAVPVGGIPAETAVTAYVLVFSVLVDEMALTDSEIDELLEATPTAPPDAEGRVVRRGAEAPQDPPD